ncbi:MAG TPA: antitoxin Xre-like helix-turn-helix domain-containing protein [Thermoanaerobaculia bacterium]|jgi:putative toxin-antitoxin system antitoxin component (TIGR02293 family)|nr:antitoxin Xre-like helix-turn-helix domain-containing protein [Thermoanaerobaculia bacterium]
METTPADVERYRELRRTTARPHAYAALLGLSVYDAEPLMKAMHRGFAWKTFTRLVDNIGLPADEIASVLDLPLRTRARRKVEGRFGSDESDRLLRLARVYARALDLFGGDRKAALRWLTEPKIALSGAIPLHLAKTDFGAREIDATIDRIEHGVYM